MTKRLKLANIIFDGGTQVRAVIDEAVVADYAERMREGVRFPPAVVFGDGKHYFMADGFHRSRAARRAALTEIEAEVRTGTRLDALWFALGANRTNGSRLTSRDKRHAIELALQQFPHRSNRHIASGVGCSEKYVRDIKATSQVRTSSHLPSRVVGLDGKSYPSQRQSSQPFPAAEAPTPPTWVVHDGDALTALRTLPPGSIQTVVTSPPYFQLRSFGTKPVRWGDGTRCELGREDAPEAYVAHLVEVFRELRRVLRDDGTAWLCLGDRFRDGVLLGVPWMAVFGLVADGWPLRSEIIWARGYSFHPETAGACLPESTRSRPHRD